MDTERLRQLLEQVRDGALPVDEAMGALRSLPFEDLGFAKLDHHRALRNGFPEVIYCPGKTTEHILAILEKLTARATKILASRAAPEVAAAVLRAFPAAVYHEAARMLVVPGEREGRGENHGKHGETRGKDNLTTEDTERHGEREEGRGKREEETQNAERRTQNLTPENLNTQYLNTRTPEHPNTYAAYATSKPTKLILVLAAGTADLPVAEEAAVTAAEMGSSVETLYDVGVAGIHRLFAHQDKLFAANVLIVVAGMEGALPSVVGGLVSRPVIAVPTSVGYGASFGGLSALLTMLNSCASGIGVVNIDNGFGAGYLAHLINMSNTDKNSASA